MKNIISIVLLLCTTTASHAQQFYDVTKYGAKKDSSAKVTGAIKKAIEAASKAGGGTVYFPAGKYLTGAIHLKSNITIFIDAGAELHFSDDFNDYLPMVESRYEGVDVMSFSPLFYAYKAENIAIKGSGKINGHGKKWWDYVEGFKEGATRNKWQLQFDSLNKNILLPDDPRQMKRGFLRPPFIQPMYCKNVLIEGITITNSPFWTVNPEFCENVTVDAVTINNLHSPNTDGINPESCKYVHISNCHISVGDDCITIKSGKDIPGRTRNMAAENYTITNCTMLSGHGGVVIGSEMSGGVKKITISNCIFDGTDRGIRIKTARGRGGVVEDIRVDNIIMKNIKDQAIVLDMEYAQVKPEPLSERTPQFRNIRFSNITAYTKQAMYINGLDEMPVQEISLNDVVFEAETGIVINNAKDIELHNVRVNTKTGSALQATQVQRLDVDGLVSAKPITDIPLIKLMNVQDVLLRNCWPFAGTKIFAAINGAETKSVRMLNNELGEAIILYGDEVKRMVNK
ncbi:MAG: glycoside hydrolase family 28 protein [Ferruginibacter sp.]